MPVNKVLVISKEYPPHVYGGAGVHVEYLTRELSRLLDVEVRRFGGPDVTESGGPLARGFSGPSIDWSAIDPRLAKSIEPISVNLEMLSRPVEADLVHCHTWYSMMAGLWAKTLYGIPLVVTTHSLEPLRPWKEEQLGRGYHLSSWIERTAVRAADGIIAVSEATRGEVIECYDLDPEKVHIVHNGIDLALYRSADAREVLTKYGVEPEKPYLLFVGRITRQKGVIHLVRALEHVTPDLQVVLCAGAPDTDEIAGEMEATVREVQSRRDGVHWIDAMVPLEDIVPLYGGAELFVCPSVYEPFGIINLEAMACETPVVASKVGGIPEVVVDGETGVLVPVDAGPAPVIEPRDPPRFARDLAEAINRLAKDPELRQRMAAAGRRRVEEHFSWESIARKTAAVYERVIEHARAD